MTVYINSDLKGRDCNLIRLANSRDTDRNSQYATPLRMRNQRLARLTDYGNFRSALCNA